jgi:hypothetical protein
MDFLSPSFGPPRGWFRFSQGEEQHGAPVFQEMPGKMLLKMARLLAQPVRRHLHLDSQIV